MEIDGKPLQRNQVNLPECVLNWPIMMPAQGITLADSRAPIFNPPASVSSVLQTRRRTLQRKTLARKRVINAKLVGSAAAHSVS